jgi:hypothetical protein
MEPDETTPAGGYYYDYATGYEIYNPDEDADAEETVGDDD